MTVSLIEEQTPGKSDDPLLAVERAMHGLCSGDDPVNAMLREHLGTGGKRIRAALAFRAASLLGASAPEATLWAAACELLHNATLIHDDLQDGDTVRRGQPTLWAKYGAASAITAGDMMLMLPYIAIDRSSLSAKTKCRLHECIARRAIQTAIGQATELELGRSDHPTWEGYERSAVGKTGQFFGLPLEGAMLIAGMSAARARSAGATFEMLGVFFQMLDDVVDLYGEKGRQEAGCDIREGKMSALIVAHLERFPADAAWLLSVLRTPRGETTSEQVETVRVRLRESGTMAETLRRAMELLAGIRGSDTVRRYPALRPVIEATAARSLGTVSHLLSTESNTQMEQRNAS